MKKLSIVLITFGFIALIGCDNSKKNNNSTQERHSGDTTMVQDSGRINN